MFFISNCEHLTLCMLTGLIGCSAPVNIPGSNSGGNNANAGSFQERSTLLSNLTNAVVSGTAVAASNNPHHHHTSSSPSTAFVHHPFLQNAANASNSIESVS